MEMAWSEFIHLDDVIFRELGFGINVFILKEVHVCIFVAFYEIHVLVSTVKCGGVVIRNSGIALDLYFENQEKINKTWIMIKCARITRGTCAKSALDFIPNV